LVLRTFCVRHARRHDADEKAQTRKPLLRTLFGIHPGMGGVSAAIVSRAVEQYLRAMEHCLVETPATVYSDLCNSGSSTLSSTGTYHLYQPSLSEPMLTEDVESRDTPPSSVAPASASTGLASAPQYPPSPVSRPQRPRRMMQLPSGEVRDLPRPAQIAQLLPTDQVATHIAVTSAVRTCSNAELGLRDGHWTHDVWKNKTATRRPLARGAWGQPARSTRKPSTREPVT